MTYFLSAGCSLHLSRMHVTVTSYQWIPQGLCTGKCYCAGTSVLWSVRPIQLQWLDRQGICKFRQAWRLSGGL